MLMMTDFELLSSIISPIISIPQLGGENEILKMNFALWADLPDFDGAGDNLQGLLLGRYCQC